MKLNQEPHHNPTPFFSTLITPPSPFHRLVVRSDFGYGWGNGYVGVPPGHPWYGRDIDWLDATAHVHGGVTWARHARACRANMGFITDRDLWYVGFDTSHYGDNASNCCLTYVIDQTAYLDQQAQQMTIEARPLEASSKPIVEQFEET